MKGKNIHDIETKSGSDRANLVMNFLIIFAKKTSRIDRNGLPMDLNAITEGRVEKRELEEWGVYFRNIEQKYLYNRVYYGCLIREFTRHIEGEWADNKVSDSLVCYVLEILKDTFEEKKDFIFEEAEDLWVVIKYIKCIIISMNYEKYYEELKLRIFEFFDILNNNQMNIAIEVLSCLQEKNKLKKADINPKSEKRMEIKVRGFFELSVKNQPEGNIARETLRHLIKNSIDELETKKMIDVYIASLIRRCDNENNLIARDYLEKAVNFLDGWPGSVDAINKIKKVMYSLKFDIFSDCDVIIPVASGAQEKSGAPELLRQTFVESLNCIFDHMKNFYTEEESQDVLLSEYVNKKYGIKTSEYDEAGASKIGAWPCLEEKAKVRDEKYRLKKIEEKINKEMEGALCRFGTTGSKFIGDLSEVISDSHCQLDLIKEGVDAYLHRSYVLFLHIIIPKIELLLFELLRQLGESVPYNYKKQGADERKMLGTILQDDSIQKALGGERVARMYRTIFIEPAGFNLRNKLCHGLFYNHDCSQFNSNMVFLCFFGLITNLGAFK